MNYSATQVEHKGQKRIAVQFPNQPELISRFKKLEGARWSATMRCWHVPDMTEYRKRFGIEIKNIMCNQIEHNKGLVSGFNEENQQIMIRYENELKVKKYSDSTIKVYRQIHTGFIGTLQYKYNHAIYLRK